MYLEKPFSESEVAKAIIVLQRNAIEDVKSAFRSFESNFSNVGHVYVTGRIPANKSLDIRVSRSLTKNGAFVESVYKLKDALKVSFNYGFTIDPQLFKLWRSYFKCLKHCTDEENWGIFTKLEQALMSLEEFIQANIVRPPYSYQSFSTELDSHVEGVISIVITKICHAVIEREERIIDGRAKELPIKGDEQNEKQKGPDNQNDFLREGIEFLMAEQNYKRDPRLFVINLIYRVIDDNTIPHKHRKSLNAASVFIQERKDIPKEYEDDVNRAHDIVFKEAKSPTEQAKNKVWRSITKKAQPSELRKAGYKIPTKEKPKSGFRIYRNIHDSPNNVYEPGY